MKLSQVLVRDRDAQAAAKRAATDLYHAFQRFASVEKLRSPLTGVERRYRPLQDGGEQLPDETKTIEFRAEDELRRAFDEEARAITWGATRAQANTVAKADLVLNGLTLPALPVDTLAQLERRLTDLNTLLQAAPVYDVAETWDEDANAKAWRNQPKVTFRTKRVKRNHKVAPATDKHAEQVQVYEEDVNVGEWTTTLFSAALSPERKRELLARVRAMQVAVRSAREEANLQEVESQDVGKVVTDWLLA